MAKAGTRDVWLPTRLSVPSVVPQWAGCQQSSGAVALRSADGCCCFVAGLSLLEQGRQQDLDAHLVSLLLLWWLDQLADYGGDGGFTGRGRDRGGPAVCSRDVAQPDGTRDLEHGVDVTLVVGAAGADDDVRDQHVVRLLLRDEAGFLGSVDGG